MKTFRIRLRFTSPCRTPLQSDTIFGCLCWIIRYTRGEKTLKDDILQGYDEEPSLLVSDGFPEGQLPFPCLPPLSREDEDQLFSEFFHDTSRTSFFAYKALMKRFRKRAWVGVEEIEENAGLLNALTIAKSFLRGVVTKEGKIKLKNEDVRGQEIYEELIPHNTINRMTGRVEKEGGGFFHTTERSMKYPVIDVYLKTSLAWEAGIVRQLFEQLGQWGYGGDRSTGRGQFVVEEAVPCRLPETGNAVMSLSHFVPDGTLDDGFYNLETKYGKLGGHYSQGSAAFPKTPVVMLTPGSVFKVRDIRPFYGVSLGAVHPELTGVRQQTYLFPYFISLGED